MFYVMAKLKFSDEALFTQFEKKALGILQNKYGKLLLALRSEKEKYAETHLLEFPSKKEFENFRKDSELVELQELREKAILKTELTFFDRRVPYDLR